MLPERDRLVSIAITIAMHVADRRRGPDGGAWWSHPKVMQELSVQITPEKPKPVEDFLKPPPKLAPPAPVTAPRAGSRDPDRAAAAGRRPAAGGRRRRRCRRRSPAPQTAAGEGRDSFLARLLAQLNRFKQYPRAARQAHIEGVVMLHFVMDAQGKVVSFEIAKSSGRPVLDTEALALIQRAQPLPALPRGFSHPHPGRGGARSSFSLNN